VFPRKHRTETPIERIFRQVTGRKMNRTEKRYLLRKRRSKRSRHPWRSQRRKSRTQSQARCCL